MIHQVNVHKVNRFEGHTFCYCYEIFQREYSKMNPTPNFNLYEYLASFVSLPSPSSATWTHFTHPIPLSARIILKQILAVTSSNIQCSDFSNFLRKIIFHACFFELGSKLYLYISFDISYVSFNIQLALFPSLSLTYICYRDWVICLVEFPIFWIWLISTLYYHSICSIMCISRKLLFNGRWLTRL